jgi:hypothetical protein
MTEWKKIFTSCSSNRELIFRKYKELKKINNKITNNPTNKWANEQNKQFSSEKVQMANKYIKIFDIFSHQGNTNQLGTPVAHACNPSNSGGRDQEDYSFKPAQANSLQDPILKIPITKKDW